MAERNASLSATLSAVYATFLLLGWAALAPRIAWSQLGAVTKFWTIGASVGTVLAVALGWIYRGMGWRAAGVIHALLMSIIGLVGFFHGAGILSDKSIAGGQGPDANPVAGIIYLAALVEAGLGALAIACGIAVMWSLFEHPADSAESP
jgi:hypothetical protein